MENKKMLIDANPDDCIKKTKRKTHFAKIIVSGTAEKPYYDIMWFDYMDGQYHIGYGSYNLDFVFQWLSECFEIEDTTVDAVEVAHGRWIDRPSMKGQVYCSECATIEKATDSNYRSRVCPNCGAKMDGGKENA